MSIPADIHNAISQSSCPFEIADSARSSGGPIYLVYRLVDGDGNYRVVDENGKRMQWSRLFENSALPAANRLNFSDVPVGGPFAESTTSAEAELSQEGKARWVEAVLKREGFPSRLTSKISSGSYLLRLGNRRTVDVYPSGKLVLAFMKDGIDHIYGFKLSDLDRLVTTLKHGSEVGV